MSATPKSWGTLVERLRLQDPDTTDDDIYDLVLGYIASDDGERFRREIIVDLAAESGVRAAFEALFAPRPSGHTDDAEKA